MIYVEVEQRSESWHQERAGSLGGSEIYDATAKQKSGKYYATRETLLYKKLAERLGIKTTGFVSGAMKDGINREDAGRNAYAVEMMCSVQEVGLYKHNRLKAHASPDGVITGSNIGLEIKCQQPANHIKNLMTGVIDEKYLAQIQWQIAICGFSAVDYVAFNPDFPPSAQLFVKRIERDDAMIAELDAEAEKFINELDELEQAFRAKYGME